MRLFLSHRYTGEDTALLAHEVGLVHDTLRATDWERLALRTR
jgi:hypothetical protein